jgi:hypothetical protein
MVIHTKTCVCRYRRMESRDRGSLDGVGFGVTGNPTQCGDWSGGANKREPFDCRYLTGFDWLVYKRLCCSNGRNNTTGADKAPRTAKLNRPDD